MDKSGTKKRSGQHGCYTWVVQTLRWKARTLCCMKRQKDPNLQCLSPCGPVFPRCLSPGFQSSLKNRETTKQFHSHVWVTTWSEKAIAIFFYITTKPEGRLFSLRRSIFKWPTCGFRDITQKKSFTSSSCLITVQILFRSLQLQWKNTTGVVESYLSPGAEWHSIFKQQLLTVMSDGRKLLGGLAEY